MSKSMHQLRFEVMEYDGHDIRLYYRTRSQVLSICAQPRDWVLAPPLGIHRYLGGNGQIIEPGYPSTLWTDTTLSIIEVTQLNPGVYLGLDDLNRQAGLDYQLRNSLWRTLQGTFKKLQAPWPGPHLIEVSRGPRVRWVAKHTWLHVKLVALNAQPPSSAGGTGPSATKGSKANDVVANSEHDHPVLASQQLRPTPRCLNEP